MSEANRPGKVIIMVVTDGEENSSRTWTKEKIKEAVEHQINFTVGLFPILVSFTY